MQLIDAAPRAHAFIAYAGAGGFDLAESLHALLVPAMYSSVVADADGPPLNGAKEKGGAKAADVWASGADLPMAMCGCDLFIAALGDGALKSERMVKLLDAAASCGMRVALVRPDGAAEPVPADVAAAAADGALGAAAVSWLLSAGAAPPPAPSPSPRRRPHGRRAATTPLRRRRMTKTLRPTAPAPPPLLSYDEADVQPLRHELERVVLAARQTHQETYGVAAMSRDNPGRPRARSAPPSPRRPCGRLTAVHRQGRRRRPRPRGGGGARPERG